MAAFGWSASDLIEATRFVVKIAAALRECGGAASDYEESVDFLCAVELTLQSLCRIRPLLRCDVHAAVIQGQAQSIGNALKIFIDDVEKFDKALGNQRQRGFRHGVLRKVQWATCVSKEVAKLREKISLPIATINTNLGVITLNSISTLQSDLPLEIKEKITLAIERDLVPQVKAQIGSVNDNISTHHLAIQHSNLTLSDAFAQLSLQLQDNVKAIHNKVATTENKQALTQERFEKAISENTLQLQAIHHSLSKRLKSNMTRPGTELKAAAGISADWEDLWRHAGQCLLLFVACIHHLIVELIKILAPRLRVYALSLQHLVSNLPKLLCEDRILFEDVLGRRKYLPFEFFQNWNLLNTYIGEQFRGMPGEYKVATNQYYLLDRRTGKVLQQNEWRKRAHPKINIAMAVVLDQLEDEVATCPRCLYPAVLFSYDVDVACSECNLLFRRARDSDASQDVGTIIDSDACELERASVAYYQATKTKATSPGAEALDAVSLAAGDFLNLQQRQEEIQLYRRVYIRASDNISTQAERLETWIYRSKWFADRLLSSFESHRQFYNDDEIYVNAVVDFNIQQLEFGTTASRLVCLRPLFMEESRDRFMIYIKLRFLVNRLRHHLKAWNAVPRLQWTALAQDKVIGIVTRSSSTLRDVLSSIAKVPSIVKALDFLEEVASSKEQPELCTELERLLSRLGTSPLHRYDILAQIHAVLSPNPHFLLRFQSLLCLADQQDFHRIDCPLGLEMQSFSDYQQGIEFLETIKQYLINNNTFEALSDILEFYHQGPTLRFYQKISQLFASSDISFMRKFNLHMPVLLFYGRTRALAKPQRRYPMANSMREKDANPWSCDHCHAFNHHILSIGRCSNCGYVRNDLHSSETQVLRAVELFKDWVGIIAPNNRLDSTRRELLRIEENRAEIELREEQEKYKLQEEKDQEKKERVREMWEAELQTNIRREKRRQETEKEIEK